MRFSNRLLVIALTVVLMLSLSSLSFADTPAETQRRAEVLNELGLFLGVDLEVFTPDLEGLATRASAMAMVGRALGWMETDEWDDDAVSGFTDVPDWAEPYVALAVDQEITLGIGDNLFGANMHITERQLQTWFDRAMGDGDTWEANVELDNDTALARAVLVDGTWLALQETPVDAEETLIESIVADDDDMKYIAIKGGLVAPREVEIDPDDYDVTIDDVEKGFYAPGDTLTFVVRGLEPLTEQEISVLIHRGGNGFPFHSPIFVGGSAEVGEIGIVNPEGALTVSGVLKEDLPEGPFAVTVAGYGITIDNTMQLMVGDHTVVLGEDPDPDMENDLENGNDTE